MRFTLKLLILMLCLQPYGYSASRLGNLLKEEGRLITRALSLGWEHNFVINTPNVAIAHKYSSAMPFPQKLGVRYFSTDAIRSTDGNLKLVETPKTYPILEMINAEINKLSPKTTFDEKVDYVLQYIKDKGISAKEFQEAVANNCAVQLINSEDLVFKYCSGLYKNHFMHPLIPPIAREEEGSQIRSVLDRCGHSYEALENQIINLYVATLLK